MNLENYLFLMSSNRAIIFSFCAIMVSFCFLSFTKSKRYTNKITIIKIITSLIPFVLTNYFSARLLLYSLRTLSKDHSFFLYYMNYQNPFVLIIYSKLRAYIKKTINLKVLIFCECPCYSNPSKWEVSLNLLTIFC